MHYQKLRDLLAARKWQEADEETANVMLKVAGQEERWLDTDSVKKIPCEDLSTIDQLWVSSSNGRFGFSVQKRIWESVTGNYDYDYDITCKFGERVGWYVNKEWLNYSDLTFSPNAPEGHLPFVIYPGRPLGEWGLSGVCSFCGFVQEVLGWMQSRAFDARDVWGAEGSGMGECWHDDGRL